MTDDDKKTYTFDDLLTPGRYASMMMWLLERAGFGAVALMVPAPDGQLDGQLVQGLIRVFQGAAGLKVDGSYGPVTDKTLRELTAEAPEVDAADADPPEDSERASSDDGQAEAAEAAEGAGPLPIRAHSKRGFRGYGGGRVDEVLSDLAARGELDISRDDIEMFQRMANVETSGWIQGINSFDNVWMSVGFMQWPIVFHDPVGKLQRWIKECPKAFARYGVELDEEREPWRLSVGGSTYTSVPFRGVGEPDELRTREWAERFFRAGVDHEAIVAEIAVARLVLEEAKANIVKRCGDGFLRFYDQSPTLRALIQETFNNRPAWLRQALSRAMEQAEEQQVDDAERFRALLSDAIIEVYRGRDKEKAGHNMVEKTGALRM